MELDVGDHLFENIVRGKEDGFFVEAIEGIFKERCHVKSFAIKWILLIKM
jgi:hypothetical protein